MGSAFGNQTPKTSPTESSYDGRMLLSLLLTACTIKATGPDGGSSACTAPTVWYADADGDGLGNDTYTTLECDAPAGYVATTGDCDDADPAVLDGADFYADGDGDQYGDARTATRACTAPAAFVDNADDCNDDEADIHPEAVELCDGVDADCDEVIDNDPSDGTASYADVDGDGQGAPDTEAFACELPDDRATGDADCDDNDAGIHPGADEHCDRVDEDCDGAVDENAVELPTWYADLDGDTYGGESLSFTACEAPDQYVADNTDCDDLNDEVYPGADEYCNGVDDDCNDVADESYAVDVTTFYGDSDLDGYGDAASMSAACTAPAGYVVSAADCDDADGAISPAGTEVCGGADENCDGSIDEDSAAGAPTWYADADSDGYGDEGGGAPSCVMPSGSFADASDCEPTDATAYPGADETCGDADDHDCNGLIDDNCMPEGDYDDSDASVRIDGHAAGAYLGYDPNGLAAGDLDGDGIGDLLVGVAQVHTHGVAYGGSLYYLPGPLTSGTIDSVASGEVYGIAEADRIGEQVALVGDIDGDGNEDVAASWRGVHALLFLPAPYTGSGAVSTFTDAIKATDTTWSSQTFKDIEGIGDWDGDGQDDFAVSTDFGVRIYLGPLGSGTVNVASALTFSITLESYLGNRMTHGDFDRDGYPDLVMGDYNGLYAYILRGASTGSWVSPTGPCPDRIAVGSGLGGYMDVANVGDADGDGFEDIGAGAGDQGTVWIMSGDVSGIVSTTTDALATIEGGGMYEGGWAISGMDIDADGLSEVLSGAQLDDSGAADGGAAYLYAGPVSGTLLDGNAHASVFGTGAGYYLGENALIVPDMTGEGCPDLVLGAGFAANNGAASGSLYVFPCE